jgi:hypothetical protein
MIDPRKICEVGISGNAHGAKSKLSRKILKLKLISTVAGRAEKPNLITSMTMVRRCYVDLTR